MRLSDPINAPSGGQFRRLVVTLCENRVENPNLLESAQPPLQNKQQ